MNTDLGWLRWILWAILAITSTVVLVNDLGFEKKVMTLCAKYDNPSETTSEWEMEYANSNIFFNRKSVWFCSMYTLIFALLAYGLSVWAFTFTEWYRSPLRRWCYGIVTAFFMAILIWAFQFLFRYIFASDAVLLSWLIHNGGSCESGYVPNLFSSFDLLYAIIATGILLLVFTFIVWRFQSLYLRRVYESYAE